MSEPPVKTIASTSSMIAGATSVGGIRTGTPPAAATDRTYPSGTSTQRMSFHCPKSTGTS